LSKKRRLASATAKRALLPSATGAVTVNGSRAITLVSGAIAGMVPYSSRSEPRYSTRSTW
jgi:hypothetical protein